MGRCVSGFNRNEICLLYTSITKDTKAIDEMKRWLLKQKQTQTWETPIATADAVYASVSYTHLSARLWKLQFLAVRDVFVEVRFLW